MTQAEALRVAQRLRPPKPGWIYPYARQDGDTRRIGYQELPRTGSGQPEDHVLGYGPSWEDAVRMAEQTP